MVMRTRLDHKIRLIKDLCSLARKKAFIEAHTCIVSGVGDLYDLGKIKAHL